MCTSFDYTSNYFNAADLHKKLVTNSNASSFDIGVKN